MWAAERGLAATWRPRGDEQVRELIQGVVDAVNADRSRYEQIKRFAILPRDFTMDDDEITPTLKLKRRVVMEHFARRARGALRRRDAEPGRRHLTAALASRPASTAALLGFAP